ncbi:hypothetical protein SBADM41S_10306 [Streptomyces badius]
MVRGAQRGREMGFPTANVETLPHTAIPADGVYAGSGLEVDGESMPAAISVGTNPQFDGTERTVEAYAIDRVDSRSVRAARGRRLPGACCGMLKFDSIDERPGRHGPAASWKRRVQQVGDPDHDGGGEQQRIAAQGREAVRRSASQ